MVIHLERGADLHMVQLMPLPLTVSCSNKIQIGFTFLVPAHPRSPRMRAIVVLGLVFSIPSQETGLGKRPRNDLFCVEWDVKPQLSQSVTLMLPL